MSSRVLCVDDGSANEYNKNVLRMKEQSMQHEKKIVAKI